MIVLGIETSCDETAAAVVDDTRAIRSDVVRAQLEQHALYGGVVPEIAARAHLEVLDQAILRALREASVGFADLSAVAATGGPGLIGGVIVGVMMAKAISVARRLPFIAVNHLEGHALTARLSHDVAFPYLLLLVSGGHCQLVVAEGVGRYRRLGTTLDDAVGETFDKAAALLGLGYPGGPEIERLAASGDPRRYNLPRPLKGRAGCDFSFSGLKTALRLAVEALSDGGLSPAQVADFAASFQQTVTEILADRCRNAIAAFRDGWPSGKSFVIAGGVAANGVIRTRLAGLAAAAGLDFVAPPQRLCTDNGAMIAWVGIERLRMGWVDGHDFAPRPRWPLESLARTG
jgi:N6-L-threonylcarbamoyladenine synthase